ncbi:MAG: hypothetical protein KDJ54_03795 [Candidatus Competibacteraceae bacterium]|nr:hypothetical protein [Candidatus Competibacteraceae bacterium]
MLKAIKFLTCADIPEMVLIRAHFNGLIKDIYLRDSEIREISKNSKETVYELKIPSVRKRGDHYIQEIWKSKEEIINESFNTILLTLPPEHLGQVIADLFGLNSVIPLWLVTLEWKHDMGSVIGDPDIILCDESQKHIFLIELKIQAKKTNGKFSLQQYTKYSNLIQLLELNGKLAKAALLAPSDEINKSIVNNEVNWFDYKDNTLIPSKERINGRPSFVTNKTVVDYPSYIDYQNREIKTHNLDIQPNKYFTFKYISFTEFRNGLMKVAPHLEKPFAFIESYSTF